MKNILSKEAMTLLIIGVLLLLLLATAIVWAARPSDPHGVDNITLCHATGNTSNPYTLQKVSKSSAIKHIDHVGPIYTTGATTWGDIIPWFSYKGTDFMGLNWPEGEAIVTARCVV